MKVKFPNIQINPIQSLDCHIYNLVYGPIRPINHERLSKKYDFLLDLTQQSNENESLIGLSIQEISSKMNLSENSIYLISKELLYDELNYLILINKLSSKMVEGTTIHGDIFKNLKQLKQYTEKNKMSNSYKRMIVVPNNNVFTNNNYKPKDLEKMVII